LNTELEGNVVLVTGGGQGLGAAIATKIAEGSANVFVADLSERAESVAATLTKDDARVYALRGDVGNEDECFPDLDPAKLQDPRDVARAVRFALTQPRESVIAEITVLPVHETSWP